MLPLRRALTCFLFVSVVSPFLTSSGVAQETDVDRLVAAMLGETPLVSDLRELTDAIGGRPTGSRANLDAVDWGMRKFREAGVTVRKEAFTMPGLWLERSCEARVSGDVAFQVPAAAMPFAAQTGRKGIEASLVDMGHGTADDFTRAGDAARGAFLFFETPELLDVDGLFREYTEAAEIEKRAFAAGAAGVVYMSSRPDGVLYRHNASLGFDNEHPIVAIERSQAQRILRLLRSGKKLDLWVRIEIEAGGPYESFNVVGEIPGSDTAGEIVVIGAHLDSWGLGQGANDNGCNVAMMIDIARQMMRLGITPRRTIRFILWNGEEQGLFGSWMYTRDHADELDRHVMAGSIDIGSGRITGFLTGGRPEIVDAVGRALEPVAGLGPFQHFDVPVVGTDNYDFMMQGVANIVGNHESYNYGPTYHGSNDTFDKVDLRQLRQNAAIVAAVVYGFAEMDCTWERQTRAEVQALIDTTSLGEEMWTFGLMAGWEDGTRGRK